MSLESTTNAIEDHLIDSISFKLQPGASYVTDRRSVSFFPQGSNIYKPQTGTKVIKIALTGTGEWLDPSTVQLQFQLKNEDNKKLYVVGAPHSFIRRARLMCGGTVVEDIDQYNRVHEMMSILSGSRNRDMDDVSGTMNRWDSETLYPLFNHNAFNSDLVGERPGNPANFTGATSVALLSTQVQAEARRHNIFWNIAPDGTKVLSTKLLFGLLHQPKWIPLRYAPLTLELELVNAFTDVCVNPDNVRFRTTTSGSNIGTSVEWSIQQVELKCDVCTLDNALENSYEAHLLGAGTLPINYNTYINQQQNITGQTDIAINVSRAISRLKSIFINFSKKTSSDRISTSREGATGNGTDGTNADYDGGVLASFGDINKPWNGFYHPMSGQEPEDEEYQSALELEVQIQIGSKQFPEYPMKSLAETYAQLRKTMGILDSTAFSFDITGKQYEKLHHIIGIDAEKTLHAGYTGLDMKRGQLMTVKVKASDQTVMGANGARRMPDNIHIVLHSDQILDIGFTGTQVQD